MFLCSCLEPASVKRLVVCASLWTILHILASLLRIFIGSLQPHCWQLQHIQDRLYYWHHRRRRLTPCKLQQICDCSHHYASVLYVCNPEYFRLLYTGILWQCEQQGYPQGPQNYQTSTEVNSVPMSVHTGNL